MRKIDKVKLIEKFLSEGWSGRVVKIVENFPEEQEIDFDALCKEFNEICLKKDCDNCSSVKCAFDFLKSKNLTVPKSVDIPVKKTWTLKKEYYDFAIDMLQPISLMQTTDKEPKHKQYYDLHEEPDYSKIPKGSIVEIECLGDKFYRTFVKFEHEDIFTKDGEETEQWSPTLIIRIVELAKE